MDRSRRKRKKRGKWGRLFLKGVLVLGLVWKWMPVLVVRDGNGGDKSEAG